VLLNIRKETPSVLLLRRKKWVERKGGGVKGKLAIR